MLPSYFKPVVRLNQKVKKGKKLLHEQKKTSFSGDQNVFLMHIKATVRLHDKEFLCFFCFFTLDAIWTGF